MTLLYPRALICHTRSWVWSATCLACQKAARNRSRPLSMTYSAEKIDILSLFLILSFFCDKVSLCTRLSWNSWSFCLSHPSAYITSVHHQVWHEMEVWKNNRAGHSVNICSWPIWETEIRKIEVWGQPEQKVHKSSSQQIARWGSTCLSSQWKQEAPLPPKKPLKTNVLHTITIPIMHFCLQKEYELPIHYAVVFLLYSPLSSMKVSSTSWLSPRLGLGAQ
jgi:hypothetical protein